MEKCDFCIAKEVCIGEFPGPDGKCLGFAVPAELQESYRAFLEEEKKNDFAALCRPKADDLIDPTGILLTPSLHGKDCLGNGEHTGIECCCDECDHFLTCFPEYE